MHHYAISIYHDYILKNKGNVTLLMYLPLLDIGERYINYDWFILMLANLFI